jgi:hypothetical protein
MQLVEVFESDNSLYLIFDFMQGGQLLTKVEVYHLFIVGEIYLQRMGSSDNHEMLAGGYNINSQSWYHASRS